MSARAIASVIVLLAFAQISNGEEKVAPNSETSVQIGAMPQSRPAPPSDWKPPLDRSISVRMLKGSLRSYFDEIGRQAKLEFIVIPSSAVDECMVTAYLQNITSREALQLALSVRGFTFQQAGRSNVYVIAPRNDGPFCERIPPAHEAEGSCTAMSGKSVSLDCADGGLSEYVEIVFKQSQASFFFWDGAEDFPISAKLRGASLDRVMAPILANNQLQVERLKASATFAISFKTRQR